MKVKPDSAKYREFMAQQCAIAVGALNSALKAYGVTPDHHELTQDLTGAVWHFSSNIHAEWYNAHFTFFMDGPDNAPGVASYYRMDASLEQAGLIAVMAAGMELKYENAGD